MAIALTIFLNVTNIIIELEFLIAELITIESIVIEIIQLVQLIYFLIRLKKLPSIISV